MDKKIIASIVFLNFILPALVLAQDPVSQNNIIFGNERGFVREGGDVSVPNDPTGESKEVMFADEIIAKKEDLKKNLDLKLKDAQKKEIVIKADKEINALNVKGAGNYRSILSNVEKILNNIVARADLLEKNGRNVAPVRVAIEKARETIALSGLAVETQSVKIYTVTISFENKIKEDVNVERAAIRADLSRLKNSIETARDAVKDAAVALAHVAGLGGGVSATNSKTTQ